MQSARSWNSTTETHLVWGNHFGKRTAWSLIYFLNYAYLEIWPSVLFLFTLYHWYLKCAAMKRYYTIKKNSRITFYFKYPNSYVSMMLSSSLRLVSLIRSSSLSSIGLEKISFLHLKNLFNFPNELNRFWSGSGLKITGSAIDDNKSPNFL